MRRLLLLGAPALAVLALGLASQTTSVSAEDPKMGGTGGTPPAGMDSMQPPGPSAPSNGGGSGNGNGSGNGGGPVAAPAPGNGSGSGGSTGGSDGNGPSTGSPSVTPAQLPNGSEAAIRSLIQQIIACEMSDEGCEEPVNLQTLLALLSGIVGNEESEIQPTEEGLQEIFNIVCSELVNSLPEEFAGAIAEGGCSTGGGNGQPT